MKNVITNFHDGDPSQDLVLLYAFQGIVLSNPFFQLFTKDKRGNMISSQPSQISSHIEYPRISQIELASHMGYFFYENAIQASLSKNRDNFLRSIGFEAVLSFLEERIFKALTYGFPVNHIAKITDSRVELIEKTKEFVAIDLPNLDF